VKAAQERYFQAIALPDPMAETMFWPIENNSLQTAGGRMTAQIGVSQELPYVEKRRTKGTIVDKEIEIASADVERVELELVESVRVASYKLWFAARAISIIDENRALARKLVEVAEARYKVGGSQQDVLRAQLELESLELELVESYQEKAVAHATLAALIQAPLSEVLEVESELPIQDVSQQLELLLSEAERCNPELKSLARQIQRDCEKQRLACLEKYPDIRLGAQYGMMSVGGSISPVADGLDMISFSVGTNLPIWRQKIRAGVCEAAAERMSSTQQYASEQLSIAGQLRRLVAETDSYEQLRNLYLERIIPKAEQALTVSMSEYTVGATTFVQLIENYTDVLRFKLQAARVEADLATTFAKLERVIGCPISPLMNTVELE
jgi:outer membrane protein TolC